MTATTEAAAAQVQFQRFLDDPLSFLCGIVHASPPGQQEANVKQWLKSVGVTWSMVKDTVLQFLAVIDQRPPFIVLWGRIPALDLAVTDVQYCQLMGVVDTLSNGPVVRRQSLWGVAGSAPVACCVV